MLMFLCKHLCYTQHMGLNDRLQSIGTDKNFWRVIIATGLAGVGDQIAQFTFIWAALTFGHDGLYVAPVILAYSIPLVLFMLLGGAIGANRPIAVLMISGLGLMVVATLLATVIPITPAALIVLAAVTGVFDAVRSPTGQSLIALSVTPDHLYNANRIRQARFQVTRLAGPVVAGLLISHMGLRQTFLIVAAMYGLGSLGLVRTRLARPREGATRGIDFGAIGRGWRIIRGRPEMLWMMAFYGFSNFAWLGPLQVGVPRLIRIIFHSGPSMLGIVNGSFGVGLLLGTVLGGHIGRHPRAMRYMLLFTAGSDIVLGLAGLQGNSIGVAVTFFGSGLLFAPVGILFNTYVQSRTPTDAMTAVLSFTGLTLQGVQPVSVLASGLFGTIDPRWLFLGAGALATSADLIGFLLVGRFMSYQVTNIEEGSA